MDYMEILYYATRHYSKWSINDIVNPSGQGRLQEEVGLGQP
jgi:hypothetical protein